jgi:flagellar motor switch protein FliN
MNADASRLFAEGFLKGYWGTVGLMLANAPTFELGAIEDLFPDAYAGYVSKYSCMMHARVASGGALAVLFPAKDVNTIAAVFEGKEPEGESALAADALPALKEMFDPCLGGGASFFKEEYESIVELQDIDVVPFDVDGIETLSDLLGDDVTKAPFSFVVPDALDSDAVFLFSQALEGTIPEDRLAGASEAAAPDGQPASADLGAAISQEEIDRILGGSDEGPKPAPPVELAVGSSAPQQADAGESGALPKNLDMILDIGLQATARLGRVEMPIEEILALGPGSIIEVGHLIDEPVEFLVNNKLIARGDVVVVDERFGLRITEIVSPQERIESLR